MGKEFLGVLGGGLGGLVGKKKKKKKKTRSVAALEPLAERLSNSLAREDRGPHLREHPVGNLSLAGQKRR